MAGHRRNARISGISPWTIDCPRGNARNSSSRAHRRSAERNLSPERVEPTRNGEAATSAAMAHPACRSRDAPTCTRRPRRTPRRIDGVKRGAGRYPGTRQAGCYRKQTRGTRRRGARSAPRQRVRVCEVEPGSPGEAGAEAARPRAARTGTSRRRAYEPCAPTQAATRSAYSGFRIQRAISPTTPWRNASTQTTKISPCTTVTQAPICAR